MIRTKKTAAILNLHAKRRAAERYGIVLNKHLRRQIVQSIRQNKARLIERQSHTRTTWLVTVDDKPAVVIYDNHRHTIVTFLPPSVSECQPKVETSNVQNW